MTGGARIRRSRTSHKSTRFAVVDSVPDSGINQNCQYHLRERVGSVLNVSPRAGCLRQTDRSRARSHHRLCLFT